MIFSRHAYTLYILLIFCTFAAEAQDKPIGVWESLLPYNNAIGLATDGSSTLFPICNQTFFSYNASNSNIETFAKETGMSDIGMQCTAYDPSTKTLVLVYSNGNIDLFKDNTFYNIPDLKITSVAGNKSVYQVYAENGMAYLSTSLGVLVIDLANKIISENYQFILNKQVLYVSSFISAGNYFYAATQNGLYKANKSDPELQNFSEWQRIDSVDSFVSMATVNNTLFLASQKSVFGLINDSVKSLLYTCPLIVSDTTQDTLVRYIKAGTPSYLKSYSYSFVNTYSATIQHIDAGINRLLISEFRPSNFNGDIKIMDTNFNITDTITNIGEPLQAVQLLDSSIWIADGYYGLEKSNGGNNIEKHDPPGPSDPNSWDLYVNNKDLWIAHGGYNDLLNPLNGIGGVSNLQNGNWTNYQRYVYPPFDTLINFVSVLKDESNGTLYFGSYSDGLFILNKDGSYQLLNHSVFDPGYHASQDVEIVGIALDQQDNLWVTADAFGYQLYARAASDSAWYKFNTPAGFRGGPLIIDDNGQIWFQCDPSPPAYPGGVIIFNDNNTLSNTADDYTYHLSTGVGFGNLPSNAVLCLAKDLNNQIWIGTGNGIGIASGCPSSTAPPCDVEIPIVQYDQFAGYLFAGSNVNAIAVDGANRKWVGTDEGVWLLSPDASKIIYQFNQDNSPLPSNSIKKIAIDNVTGDVYIGTAAGLISFRSTATEGGATNQNVLVFPNPVKSGYTGTIAIKGLVANADVRITDIDGELVYRTTALGGQAVWSGTDYTGHRPQSGVYLIFVSSSDGSQTYVGKIVFMK